MSFHGLCLAFVFCLVSYPRWIALRDRWRGSESQNSSFSFGLEYYQVDLKQRYGELHVFMAREASGESSALTRKRMESAPDEIQVAW